MTLDELQEILEEALEDQDLPIGSLNLAISKTGEVVIWTGLRADADGELSAMEEEDPEDDEIFGGSEDFEPLVDEEDPEDE